MKTLVLVIVLLAASQANGQPKTRGFMDTEYPGQWQDQMNTMSAARQAAALNRMSNATKDQKPEDNSVLIAGAIVVAGLLVGVGAFLGTRRVSNSNGTGCIVQKPSKKSVRAT